jgi:uncharacterized phage protein gp47/JayE
LEKAEFAEFEINETIKMIFVLWAEGKWLEEHGRQVNTYRKEANKASGILSVTGAVGTVIPAGFLFATPANLAPSIIFAAKEQTVLNEATVEVEIEAAEGGLSGNVPNDAIKLMVRPLGGISHVTNPAPTTGGAPAETDDGLRERILEAMRLGRSFVGNNADYVRWAKETPGVGRVIVDPEWLDPDMPPQFYYTDQSGGEKCAGTVRLFIVDANGMPANQQILNAVYSHIAGTGDTDAERRMPIGAHLTVVAPAGVGINIAATLILDQGEDLNVVTDRFKANIAAYWQEVAESAQETEDNTGYVRWTQVGAVLSKTQGVADYAGLTINGSTANIEIAQGEYPVTGEVTLNE